VNQPQPPMELQVQVATLKVVDAESRAKCEGILATIKAMRSEVEAFFKPMKDKAWQAHREVTQREKETLAPLDAMKEKALSARLAYDTAQAEIQRQEAEAERQRLAAEVEAQKAQADAARREAETAAAFGDEESAAACEAVANQLEVSAFIAQKQVTKINPGKPAGTRAKKCWRVVDKSLIPREFLTPDVDALNFHASKRADQPIPGIEFYTEYIPVARGAA
jgi:hypothetical protein